MRNVTVAVTQMACSSDRTTNIRAASMLVEEAAAKGAQVVVLQELFETPYFCIEIDKRHLDEATPLAKNPAVAAMRKLAAKHDIVVPVCFYELGDDGRRFNTLAIIDAGGDILGCYRKSHIPDFPAYEEAQYFAPGDTGFKVWQTKYVRLGAGICWDQWFPEAARSMTLMGAELLMYPTAIGRPLVKGTHEPENSCPHWQRTMQGHAAANMIPLAASNRIGIEAAGAHRTEFYGSSFLANETGEKIAELDDHTQGIALATFDLDRIAAFRKYWGIFRTRRPDLYGPITSEPGPSYLMGR
ncbi:MAG: nitrilase-related carbon-nitrogen hydrolase [Hyphomicrobiaceae bacterium]